MELVIYDDKNMLSPRFARWFLRHIKSKLTQNIDIKKAKLWDKTIEEIYSHQKLASKGLTATHVLKLGIDNIIVIAIPGQLIYRIDNNVLVPGYNMLKVIDVCKLINYGNVSCDSYPLFSETFKQLENSFDNIMNEFLFTEGLV